MHAPPQGGFKEREIVFLHDGLDELEGLEGAVFEVAVSVHGALARGGGGVPAFAGDFGGFIFAAEDAAGELGGERRLVGVGSQEEC